MRVSRMIVLALSVLMSAPASLQAASTIDHWVISSGGGVTTSASFSAFTVIGEPLAGPATSATYTIQAGFIPAVLFSGTVDVVAQAPPTATSLSSIAPNPFRATAAISFDVATSSPVAVRVFDASGRLVRALADGVYSPGRYLLTWDGTNFAGSHAAAGVYYCQFLCGPVRETRRMVFIR